MTQQPRQRSWRSGWRRTARIALELLLAVAMLVAIDRWLTGGTGFAQVQPNPYWLPVLAMALAYGTGPGVLAAAIASGLWLLYAHENAGERDYLDHLFHLSLQPLMWFSAAVAIGEVTIVRTTRHARLEKHGQVAARNLARLTEAFAALSHTNRRLQVQIATEAHTIGHAIDTATRVSSIDPAARRGAIGELITLAARTADFTCYRVAGGEARAWLHGAMTVRHRDVLPAGLVACIGRPRTILHVADTEDRAMLEDVGVAAVALLDRAGGDLVGCLVLHSLPFDALNASRTAELCEIASWLTPLLADSARATHPTVRPAGLVA